ncbi:FGGY-family carbohydrate kinase [Erwinia mallotivora]|uniref:Carbohydrate kinase n=1 Tax=Erwinia mallotivora TaxID=69222 RepID=A0A014PSS9_9GAMM|nr:FGGY family carbohydrate kinase [Erwinia mallotivora]EXU73922.1 carbohydrate kinase [Erwinia mallotivora]
MSEISLIKGRDMYAIGIDVGTTNCKVCLYRIADLHLVKKHSFITPKNITEYGSDFDMATLWQGLIAGLHDVAHAVSDPQNIVSVSVASVGEAGVLLDAADNIIGPVMTWYDTRTQPQLARVVSQLGDRRLYEITGIPAHSNYSLNKILWLMEHNKAQQPASWLCMAEYIAFCLSGERRAEYSLASRTLAFDIARGDWSAEIIAAMGLPATLFSPLTVAGKPTGELLATVSEATGIPCSAKVSIAGHDHMVGAVAVGVTEPTQILNSTGTTEGLLVVGNQPSLTEGFFRSRLSNGRHVLPDAATLYASLPSAGYAIEWFSNLFGLTRADFTSMTQWLMSKGAAESPTDSFLIPHLRGSGPPQRSIHAKGLIYGLADHTDAEGFLKAVFHGLCYELRHLLETCESLTGNHWKSVLVIGAACQNPYWLQLKATILRREIVACQIPEAVSRGAALLGARGAGFEPHVAALAADSLQRYQPDEPSAAAFDRVYRQIYQPLFASKIHIENQINRT